MSYEHYNEMDTEGLLQRLTRVHPATVEHEYIVDILKERGVDVEGNPQLLFAQMDNTALTGYFTRLHERIFIERGTCIKEGELRKYRLAEEMLQNRGISKKSIFPIEWKIKPRIVVYCHGGLVQWVISDQDIEMLLIDADVTEEPMEDNSVRTYYDIDDEAFDAEAGIYQHGVAPELVKKYFDQQAEHDKAEEEKHAAENATGDSGESPADMG